MGVSVGFVERQRELRAVGALVEREIIGGRRGSQGHAACNPGRHQPVEAHNFTDLSRILLPFYAVLCTASIPTASCLSFVRSRKRVTIIRMPENARHLNLAGATNFR